jgi:hypothetical protein
MRFRHIEDHRGVWPVRVMCGALSVSRSAFATRASASLRASDSLSKTGLSPAFSNPHTLRGSAAAVDFLGRVWASTCQPNDLLQSIEPERCPEQGRQRHNHPAEQPGPSIEAPLVKIYPELPFTASIFCHPMKLDGTPTSFNF